MNVAVAMETRFVRTPDGVVWSRGWLDSNFWLRYLDHFDCVKVVARVCDAGEPPDRAKCVSADRVSFAPIPYYVGPWQYAARYLSLKKAIAGALSVEDAVILRVPGAIGSLVARETVRLSKPFGLEVVGDPADVFTAGGVKSLLRPALRWRFTRAMRRQCQQACAVAYVCNNPLRRRYPPDPRAFTTAYSSIDLDDDAFVAEPRRYAEPASPIKLVTVGSLEQLYKGPDVLIRAMVNLAAPRAGSESQAVPVTLTFIGDGKHKGELQTLARDCGVASMVRFAGRVPPGAAVRAALDEADVFVLASRTEGLPRAMIEAMARALPCVGTSVGGIAELLDESELVPPGDPHALTQKIRELTTDPDRMTLLSETNLSKSRAYHADILQPRRREMYEFVQDRTDEWLKSQRPN